MKSYGLYMSIKSEKIRVKRIILERDMKRTRSSLDLCIEGEGGQVMTARRHISGILSLDVVILILDDAEPLSHRLD